MLDWLLKDGYFRLGTLRGIPIALHFTYFIGAIFFCGLSPGRWIAFFFLILFHELGHAALARWTGHPVIRVEIYGLGGLCRYSGYSTPFDTALIAWGGVWAQGIVYIAAALYQDLHPQVHSGLLFDLLTGLTSTNVSMMLFNLLPIPPLDGLEAWKLFPLLWTHAQGERPRARWRPFAPAPKKKAKLQVNVGASGGPPAEEAPPAPLDPVKEEIFQKMIRQLDEAPKRLDDDEGL